MSSAIENKQQQVETTMRLAPVIAVVVIERLADAVPLAQALVAGGIRAIEITLRSKVALDAIRAVAANVEGAVVGAGTILSPQDLQAAENAGARFAVSPGITPTLLAAAHDIALPYLPGSASASEAMFLLEHGYRLQKFFPAEVAGGAPYLRALGGPLPQVKFCPTGGISVTKAASYLALSNVLCVGGSWLTPTELVTAGDWAAITTLARDACNLPRR